MKRILFLLLLTVAFGCKRTIVIKGIIRNYNDSVITCYYGFDDTVKVKDGKFRFTSSLLDSQYVTINAGVPIDLFVLEGDSIWLDIDAATGSYKVSGINKDINRWITNEKKMFDSVSMELNRKKLFDKEYPVFVKSFDSLCRLIPQPSEDLPLKMKSFEAKRANYFRASIYYRYPFSHALNTRTRYAHPAKFSAKAPMVNFSDSSLLELSEYRNFIVVYLDMMAKLAMEQGSKHKDNMFTNEQLDIVLNEFQDPFIKSYALQKIMLSHFEDFGAYHAGGLMKRVTDNTEDSSLMHDLRSAYKNHMNRYKGQIIVPYRKTKETELLAHLYLPVIATKEKQAAVCMFFGGGWYIGTPEELIEVAKDFAKKGYVALLFDCRTKGRFNTTPIEAIEDAKYAISWTRQNAKKWNIDTKKIIAFGHSAGGHLAASTALLKGYESPLNRLLSNSQPNAVALSPSCVNPTVDDWFCYTLGSAKGIEKLSPVHNIRKGIPPFIVFLGTKDPFIPIWTAEEFKNKMQENKNICEFHLVKNLKHKDFLNSHTVDTIDFFIKKIFIDK